MKNTMKVKIIMPSDTLFEADAEMVNIPGGNGMFGVLPGHMKLISTIQVGVVGVFVNDQEHKFFVHGGLSQITDTEVNIVTDFALSMDNQTKSDILNKIANLKSELENLEKDTLHKTDLEIDILNDNISRYHALLNFMN